VWGTSELRLVLRIYFESVLFSPTFDVLGGQTVSLTMTLTLTSTHSPSFSGASVSVSAIDSSNLLGLLALILGGQRPANTYLNLEGVAWKTGAGTVLLS